MSTPFATQLLDAKRADRAMYSKALSIIAPDADFDDGTGLGGRPRWLQIAAGATRQVVIPVDDDGPFVLSFVRLDAWNAATGLPAPAGTPAVAWEPWRCALPASLYINRVSVQVNAPMSGRDICMSTRLSALDGEQGGMGSLPREYLFPASSFVELNITNDNEVAIRVVGAIYGRKYQP